MGEEIKKIALIINASNFERQRIVIRTVTEYFRKKGNYAVYVFTSYGIYSLQNEYNIGERTIYELLRYQDFAGAIIDDNIGNPEMEEHILDILQEKGIPVVCLGMKCKDAPFVRPNDYEVAYQVLEHFITAHDCRKINHVLFVDQHPSKQYLKAYREIHEKYGIPVEEKRILYVDKISINCGKALLQEMKEQQIDDAEAVFFMHDVLAIGFTLACQQEGIDIPGTYKLATANYGTNSEVFKPSISGGLALNHAGSQKACELLEDLMAGKTVTVENYLDAECIFTDSCGCNHCNQPILVSSFQKVIQDKIDAGRQISISMNYNAFLDSVETKEQFAESMRQMFEAIGSRRFALCINEFDLDYLFAGKEKIFPSTAEVYDSKMRIVASDNEKMQDISFDRNLLISEKPNAGDFYLLMPVHRSEHVFGFIVWKNEYMPIDVYNYRICYESLGSSLENLHRHMVMKNTIAELNNLRVREPMTGLYNQYALERFGETYQNQGEYCVVVVDMDHLKKINDGYGHLAGNLAICSVAQALRLLTDEEKDLVLRYGGDEFLILSKETKKERWETFEQCLNEQLQNLAASQAFAFELGASVGFACSEKVHIMDFEECFREADQKMYANKKMRHAQK